jgi:ATP-binding cassette subfamily F protein uup
VVSGYQGTVILVSHDRDFLDRTVTSTIAPANPEFPDGQWIEYAGGYTDMLVQRKSLADEKKRAERDKPSARSEATTSSDGGKQKGKLSFKQKFAIDNLPKQMQAKEVEIAAFEKKMADPRLFSRDPDGFAKIAAQLEAARTDVHRMEEEWLELEMLREQIEG